jgi:translation initiation factor IF-3
MTYPNQRNFRGPRKPEYEHALNDEIRVPEVRVVGLGENQDGIFPTHKALSKAQELEMDLVLITENANPPVCRIVDYKKFLFEKKKKEKELKAKTAKTVVKEIRFGPNTDDHDFEFKLNHARKFLQEGSKVRAYVHFRGRTIVHKDRGELLLLKFVQELVELGKVEALPKLEGKRMFVIIDPKSVKK